MSQKGRKQPSYHLPGKPDQCTNRSRHNYLALQTRLKASNVKTEDIKIGQKSIIDQNAAEDGSARDLAASGTVPTSNAAAQAETSIAKEPEVAPRTAENTLQARLQPYHKTSSPFCRYIKI